MDAALKDTREIISIFSTSLVFCLLFVGPDNIVRLKVSSKKEEKNKKEEIKVEVVKLKVKQKKKVLSSSFLSFPLRCYYLNQAKCWLKASVQCKPNFSGLKPFGCLQKSWLAEQFTINYFALCWATSNCGLVAGTTKNFGLSGIGRARQAVMP